MDRGEVVEGLRAMLSNVSTEADDFDEHARMDRGVLREAIALLTPEPITEEGRRAEGFDNELSETFFLYLSDRLYPCITYRNGRFCLHVAGGPEDLHIESMQQLREVIKALRGKP